MTDKQLIDPDLLVWRPARESDRRNIRILFAEPSTKKVTRQNPDTMLNASLSTRKQYMFVKEVDGKFAGITYIVMIGDKATILSANMPEYQGVGIGRLVIPQIEQFLREEGIRTILIKVRNGTVGAESVKKILDHSWTSRVTPMSTAYIKSLY